VVIPTPLVLTSDTWWPPLHSALWSSVLLEGTKSLRAELTPQNELTPSIPGIRSLDARTCADLCFKVYVTDRTVDLPSLRLFYGLKGSYPAGYKKQPLEFQMRDASVVVN
jgi:hypothetical protein